MKRFYFLLLLTFAHWLANAQTIHSTPSITIRPGNGYPGELASYDVIPQMERGMARFNLTAGWFRRAPINSATYRLTPQTCPVNELPYLLFTPSRSREPVPMVLYFSGTGEQGTNLVEQFRQTTIFEKLTSPVFQARHPCYVLAPMLPKGGRVRGALPETPSNLSDLICDTMYAVIASLDAPQVDTNRLYVTGLSFGGGVAYELPCHYRGRFAASVPVSSFQSAFMIPKTQPGNYWLLYNESEYRTEAEKQLLIDLARTVKERGGDFRVATFPDKGHDAWSKAWREDVVWDWMFSKTADGNPISQPAKAATPVARTKRAGMFLDDAICAASKPGRDDGTGPERAADGLEATCYVSAEPMKRGDWWQIKFAEPVSGRIIVKSGFRDGKGRSATARVETSSDGRMWMRHGTFSSASGECRITLRAPIKYLRVLPDSLRGEILVLREVECLSD